MVVSRVRIRLANRFLDTETQPPMPDIMMVLAGLSHGLNATTMRRLAVIVEAMLSMTGRVTMLGLSRWTESGGSYRTVQRFFNTAMAWNKIHWLII